ncbi:hypothetical protein [Pengzhenrongella sp.]|jgi:hypothetical protein|uniref:hypothetical protein n=1 Tax=Pengzhenrongella sp. TaxID=2888820 RepID=UPI002F952D0A
MVPDDDAARGRAVNSPPDDGARDDLPLDLAASAALIEAQRARVAAATDVDGRLLFGAWGTSWLLGFGALYSVASDQPLLGWPDWVAGTLFAGLLGVAMIITAVHLVRRTAGVRGVSARSGAMYGWSWGLSFTGVGALGFGLSRAGVSPEVMQLVMTVVPALLVGALYMAGAAIWRATTQFVLGAWIVAVTVVAAVVGPPATLAVMSIAGGGGMLVGAGLEHLRRSRAGSRADC